MTSGSGTSGASGVAGGVPGDMKAKADESGPAMTEARS
jgi:hypothetical protein